MRKTFWQLATLLSLLLLVSFVVILVNQTAQLVELADQVHPTFGTVVFWSIVALRLLRSGTAFPDTPLA